MQLPMPKGQRGFKPSPRFHFSHNAGVPPMGKMPANDMPRQPYWDGGVAHEGQYQMYNDSANDGGGGGDLPPAAYTGPTPTSSAPDLSPSQGGPGSYPPAGPPPPDNTNYSQGSIGNGTPPQGIGDLVQPPDLPAVYNDQPMPTWMRFMPPAAQAAYWAVRGVQRIGDMYHNSHLNQGQPGQQQQPQDDGSGNSGLGSPFPKDLGGLGKPMGYFPPTGGFGHDTRNGYDPTGPMGPIGTSGIVDPNSPAGGGSFFGGRGSPIVPGSGFLNNESSLPTLAGGHSDLGADIALHSGRFRDAIANAPYLNPNFSMGMPKGMAGGQGIGGGGLPMKQNFSDGGIAGEPISSKGTSPLLSELIAMVNNDNDKRYKDLIRRNFTGGRTMTDQEVDYNDPRVKAVLSELGAGPNPAPNEDNPIPYSDGGVAQDEPMQDNPDLMASVYRYLEMLNEHKRRRAMNEEPSPTPEPTPSQPIGFHYGGMVKPKMGKSYAMGGDVSQVPPMQQLQGYGTDTVPAALTPGELILNKQQQAAVMPRPGMKSKLKPEQRAAIEIALRKKQGAQTGRV